MIISRSTYHATDGDGVKDAVDGLAVHTSTIDFCTGRDCPTEREGFSAFAREASQVKSHILFIFPSGIRRRALCRDDVLRYCIRRIVTIALTIANRIQAIACRVECAESAIK